MQHGASASLRSLLALVVALASWQVSAAPAAADRNPNEKRKVSIVGGSAELYGVKTVDDLNKDLFGLGIGGALYVELNALSLVGINWLGIQVGGMAMWLSAKDSADSTSYLGLATGLRLHWSELLLDVKDDGWVDFNYVFGESGDIRRSGFSAGLGYEFALTKSGKIRLGPFIRYMWGSDPIDNHANFLMFGVSMGFMGRYSESAEPDRDGDGVPDSEDYCPTTPQGSKPDPKRPGCPLLITDRDGDGVPDSEDQCPTIHHGPKPDPQRPGCPLMDSDGDGVPDKEDHCRDVHKGPRPDPERPGCPLPDKDQDTVPDAEDACPDEPGAPSRDPKRNGCPGLVRVQEGQIQINQPVYFATNKDTILEASFPVLRAVAEAILASDWIKKIRIEGHTDSTGPDEYNLQLSKRRAASVLRALQQNGVPASKLTSEGYGEARPVETNATPMGRAANRRVEFHIAE